MVWDTRLEVTCRSLTNKNIQFVRMALYQRNRSTKDKYRWHVIFLRVNPKEIFSFKCNIWGSSFKILHQIYISHYTKSYSYVFWLLYAIAILNYSWKQNQTWKCSMSCWNLGLSWLSWRWNLVPSANKGCFDQGSEIMGLGRYSDELVWMFIGI